MTKLRIELRYLVYILAFLFLPLQQAYAQRSPEHSRRDSLPSAVADTAAAVHTATADTAALSASAADDSLSLMLNPGRPSNYEEMGRFERKTYERSLHYGEHSPKKATIFAMVCPGLGQIYNKQYWKLPILYGGIAAAIYGVTWNNRTYNKYADAYLDLSRYMDSLDVNPEYPYPDNPAWEKISLRGAEWEQMFKERPSSMARYKEIMYKRRRNHKRNRDLCYITLAGIYALNIIDACVYAHFYDFYISDDLSLHWHPETSFNRRSGKASYGASVSLRF